MKFISRRKKTVTHRNNVSRAYIPQRKQPARKKMRNVSAGEITREITRSLQPSSWRKHLRAFWFLILVSVFVAGYIFMFKSTYFLVDKIEIVRHDMSLDRNEILGHLTEIYGQNIFMIDAKDIQEKLALDFPALAYATIHKKYPRTLEIEVDSFPSALIIVDPLGQNYLVNEVGLISKIGVDEFDLPIVRFTDNVKMKEYYAKQERFAQEEAEKNFVYPDGETPQDETGNNPEGNTETDTETAQTPDEEKPEEGVIRHDDLTSEEEDAVLSGEEVLGDATEEAEPEYLYHLGESIMSKEELQTLLDARDQFERETELMVDSIEYYPVEQEFHFIVVANYPYLVKFDFHSDIAQQFEKLKMVGEKLDLKSDPLEYIDLRIIGNKVFYKTL